MLPASEVEAVMAHELTHVKTRDVLVMTVASFFATIAAMITQFGFFFGGGWGDSDEDSGPGFLVVLLVSVAVYIISFFLMLALSRYREYAADRGSALITGRPSALASALIHISRGMETVPEQDLRAANGLSAFFIVPPEREERGGGYLHGPPAAREEARAAPAPRGAAPGHLGRRPRGLI